MEKYSRKQRLEAARRGLSQRSRLQNQRRKIVNWMLGFAVSSVISAMINCELTSRNLIDKNSIWTNFLKSLCIISNVLLLGLILVYHTFELKLIMIDSGTDDWRVALNGNRKVKLVLELLICAISPIPGLNPDIHIPIATMVGSPFPKATKSIISLDVFLGMAMFARLYLLGRFIVVNSRSIQDAATRSIAALNHVTVDFRFVLRTQMVEHPIRVIFLSTIIYWLFISWFFTLCERNSLVHGVRKQNDEVTYLNSLWLIVISFISVGYGDVVPYTHCGRALSAFSGILGIGVTAALIAVIPRMLTLSKAEKQVNAFIHDSNLTKKRNNAAASVLQNTWFIYKSRKRSDVGKHNTRWHQQKFLRAIMRFRGVKDEQRKLTEHMFKLTEKGQAKIKVLEEIQKGQQNILLELESMKLEVAALKATKKD